MRTSQSGKMIQMHDKEQDVLAAAKAAWRLCPELMPPIGTILRGIRTYYAVNRGTLYKVHNEFVMKDKNDVPYRCLFYIAPIHDYHDGGFFNLNNLKKDFSIESLPEGNDDLRKWKRWLHEQS